MSETREAPSIDFSQASTVLVKHKPGAAPKPKGEIVERDLTYAINKSRGERFIFTKPKFQELNMQDNSINAKDIGGKLYFQIVPGRTGDMFRGKESSTNKSTEEKLPDLAQELLDRDQLYRHYKLVHQGDHEGTPWYSLEGVGEPLAARLTLEESKVEDASAEEAESIAPQAEEAKEEEKPAEEAPAAQEEEKTEEGSPVNLEEEI